MSSTFECCKQGSFHKGTPKGTETTVAGRKAYVTGPEDAKAAVLLIADVFGWALNNTRVLADGYAEGIGARVYVPDFFDGEALPTEIMDDPEKRAKFDLMAFLGKHHPRNAAYPLVEPVAKEIKSKHGKLGAIGFCWGAPSTLWLGGPGKIADAVAFAHPSVTETSDFEALEKPGLFLCAEIDQQLTDEKVRADSSAPDPTYGLN